MNRKTFFICMAVIAAVMGAVIWAGTSKKAEPEWTVVYEMANKHIEWTGAGYGGR